MRSSIPLRFRYEIALFYLKQAGYDLDIAIEAFLADDKWEREHPIEANIKGKAKQRGPRQRFGFSNGITGQLS